ncbi:hypothetical protein [Actinospica sp.]|uniref:hypothetical protein n=1 Tax=Actinospica sp. TaxID=1872142 RepID=UPI002C768316|nr:hypothetical protein [Actinospica sp.]HWG26164.1 hypothetical protein [Actinospica sp.]
MTNKNQTNKNRVRLVALGANDAPRGVPLTRTRLPSLDTPRVLEWLAEYKDWVIVVLPEGPEPADSGRVQGEPSFIVEVDEREHESLLRLMPGA